jgi:hypothetical protein
MCIKLCMNRRPHETDDESRKVKNKMKHLSDKEDP